jgi:hypothetical protein
MSVPKGIQRLTALKVLALESCGLTSAPAVLGDLTVGL